MTSIISALGHKEHTNKVTKIGNFDAIISNTLVEDLMSANPLVDSGHTITLDRHGGVILHPGTGKHIPIIRDGLRWKVLLSDIIYLTTESSSDMATTTVTSNHD